MLTLVIPITTAPVGAAIPNLMKAGLLESLWLASNEGFGRGQASYEKITTHPQDPSQPNELQLS